MLNISVHLDHVRYGTKKVLKPDSGKTIYIGFTIYILCLVLCLGNPGTGNLEAASDLIASETVTAPSVAVTRNSASSVSVNFMRVSVPSGGSKQETASAPSGAVSRPSGSTSVKAPAGVSVPRSQTSGSQVN
ncbi:MAG: hypothetical protein PHQ75_05025, partial [Thermoguttaceae bacterium]|nr:hypothetical protein [Thermoguttaceae bacterium]